MSDWTEGYVTDVDYTFGYYSELNPLRSRLALLHAGIRPSQTSTACEIGFGQGVSVNIHAAATTNDWYGTDFNPSQAAFAQELAKTSGSKAHLVDQTFAEFADREDIPEFDYICMHGIWSWVSEENRKVLVDFIRTKLKVGGVLYISYNTQPGWAPFAPMRHLLKEYAKVNGTQNQRIVSKVEEALDFAGEMLATNPKFLQANPNSREKVEALKTQSKQYLAHEYFNQNWHPLHFSETSELLKPAKLSFACSAHHLDQVDAINLTSEQQQFLARYNDRYFRESIRDFMVNQQFRRDYWVKGPRNLAPTERLELLKKERVVLVRVRSAIVLKVAGQLGSADMSEELYVPVLDFLADYKVKTLEEIYRAVFSAETEFGTLLEIVMVLAGAGYISTAQETEEVAKVRKSCDKLNKHLLVCDNFEGEVAALASPLIGGGIPVTRFQKMFIFAKSQGANTAEEWATFAWHCLVAQGQKLLLHGTALESEQENLNELKKRAKIFADEELPMLQALLVV